MLIANHDTHPRAAKAEGLRAKPKGTSPAPLPAPAATMAPYRVPNWCWSPPHPLFESPTRAGLLGR